MDQNKRNVKNVYIRLQCVERRVKYRYLITIKDHNLVNDLQSIGFSKSWISVDKGWNAFILEQSNSPDFPRHIRNVLKSHGYFETHNAFTERCVNQNGKHKPYRPNRNLNLLGVYSSPDIVYERNSIYTKIIER